MRGEFRVIGLEVELRLRNAVLDSGEIRFYDDCDIALR